MRPQQPEQGARHHQRRVGPRPRRTGQRGVAQVVVDDAGVELHRRQRRGFQQQRVLVELAALPVRQAQRRLQRRRLPPGQPDEDLSRDLRVFVSDGKDRAARSRGGPSARSALPSEGGSRTSTRENLLGQPGGGPIGLRCLSNPHRRSPCSACPRCSCAPCVRTRRTRRSRATGCSSAPATSAASRPASTAGCRWA